MTRFSSDFQYLPVSPPPRPMPPIPIPIPLMPIMLLLDMELLMDPGPIWPLMPPIPPIPPMRLIIILDMEAISRRPSSRQGQPLEEAVPRLSSFPRGPGWRYGPFPRAQP